MKERPGARTERRIRQFGSIAAARRNDRVRAAEKAGKSIKEYRTKRQLRACSIEREARHRFTTALDQIFESTLVHEFLADCERESRRLKYKSNPEKKKSDVRRRYQVHLSTERLRVKLYKHSNPQKCARWGDARQQRASVLSDGTLNSMVIGELFRDAALCPYCGQDLDVNNKSLDHMIPLAKGGAHSLRNVLICCYQCNIKKGSRSFLDWIAILSEPFKSKSLRLYHQRYRAIPNQFTLALPYESRGSLLA